MLQKFSEQRYGARSNSLSTDNLSHEAITPLRYVQHVLCSVHFKVIAHAVWIERALLYIFRLSLLVRQREPARGGGGGIQN